MAEENGVSRWKPALILVAVTVVVIALVVVFGGTGAQTNAVPSASTSASVATAPPPPPSTTATAPAVPPTASVVASATAPPTPEPSTLPSDFDGFHEPPAGPNASTTTYKPPPNDITPDWQAKKTEQALAAVQLRYDNTQKEIDALEKAGKTQEAAEKKILLKRLGAQIADMNVEIAGYKAKAAGSAGASDAGAP